MIWNKIEKFSTVCKRSKLTYECMAAWLLEPDKNPTAVEGLGSEPDNLVITWKVSYVWNLQFSSVYLEWKEKLFFYLFFNWKFSLQCCIGFCHITTRISHSYTYIPCLMILLPLPIPESFLKIISVLKIPFHPFWGLFIYL